MNDHGNNLDPVVKTRRVPLDQATAFALFTDEMGAWWPLASHSVSGSVAATVAFAGAAGGSVDETGPDGATHRWAEVLAIEPPNRVVLAWHPGAEAPPASQLSVRFDDDGDGDGCTLQITQSGWERFGAAGPERRRQYHEGWDEVLACYLDAAAARSR